MARQRSVSKYGHSEPGELEKFVALANGLLECTSFELRTVRLNYDRTLRVAIFDARKGGGPLKEWEFGFIRTYDDDKPDPEKPEYTLMAGHNGPKLDTATQVEIFRWLGKMLHHGMAV